MWDLSIFLTNFPGEVAALESALCLALGTVIFGQLGQRFPPLFLNFLKGAIVILMLLFTILISDELLVSISPVSLRLLLLSGAIGVGIGDTVYFSALNRLGARRTLLLGMLAPPIAAILGLIFLQEQLKISAWCGIMLTILGVGWVITERVSGKNERLEWRGVMFGILAALAQAIAVILSRAALVNTEISLLWSTLLRVAIGEVLLFFGLIIQAPNVGLLLNNLQSKKNFLTVICGTFFESLLIYLQQVSLKFTAAGIAQALIATSPLFVLPFAVWMGDKVTIRAVFGVIVAIAGVTLLFSWK
jgi:drug/metabolite transporter (DMT)-like permease